MQDEAGTQAASDFDARDEMEETADEILAGLTAKPTQKERAPRVIQHDEFGHPMTVDGRLDQRWASTHGRVPKSKTVGEPQEPGVTRANGITETMKRVKSIIRNEFHSDPIHTICGFQVKDAWIVELDDGTEGVCGRGELRTRRPDLVFPAPPAKAGKTQANVGAFEDDPSPTTVSAAATSSSASEASSGNGPVKTKVPADPVKVAARDAKRAEKVAEAAVMGS